MTAAKNVMVSWLLNFTIRVFFKSAVTLFGKEREKKSKEITVVLACSARVKFNGRRRGDLERNFNGRQKRERCGKETSLRSCENNSEDE